MPRLETLHAPWIDSSDPAAQKRLADAIQDEVFSDAPYVPLSPCFPRAAWRKTVTGHLKGPGPVFRNVTKA